MTLQKEAKNTGHERIVAGAFAGAGSLLCIYLGVICNRPDMATGGMLILSGMMAFFAGEKNGVKTAKAQAEAVK